MADILAPAAATVRQTVTFDNGTEFARHYELHAHAGWDTFFCYTHAPWQKGGIENAIGLAACALLPRKIDLATLSHENASTEFITACRHNTPRKCPDFRHTGGTLLGPHVALQM